jgi:hypothetical protein
MELFNIVGNIFVDDKASSSIDAVDKKASGLGGKLGSIMGIAGKVGLGIGGMAVAAGGALLAIASKAGQTADRLLDLNSITGMSTEEIQKWEYVTKIAGVSADAMTNASMKLTKSFDAMSSGTGKGAESLKTLGLSFEDLEAMDNSSRMDAITEALAGVEDKTERAKLGTDLLGGSWKEIAPIVDMGVEAMNNAKDSANIISEEDLVKANDFRIGMEKIKEQVSFFAMTLAIQLLPIAEKVFGYIELGMPYMAVIAELAFERIGKGIELLIVWIEWIVLAIQNWVADNEETIIRLQTLFMGLFEGLTQMISAFIEGAVLFWSKYGEDIMAVLKPALDIVIGIFSGFIQFITDIFAVFTALFKGDWEGLFIAIQTLATNFITNVGGILQSLVDVVLNIFGSLGKMISDGWTNLFISIKETSQKIVTDAIEWGKNIIEGFTQGIIDNAMKPVKAIQDMSSKISSGVKSFFNINSPSKVFEEFGGYLMDGLAIGVENNAIKPIEAVTNAVMGMSKAMEDAIKISEKVNHAIKYTTSGNTGSTAYANFVSASGGTSGKYSSSQAEYEKKRDELAREIAIRENVDMSVGKSMANQEMTDRVAIEQNITINSPKSLNASDIAKVAKKTLTQLALSF